MKKKNYFKLLLIAISVQLLLPSIFAMNNVSLGLEQLAHEDSGWSVLRYIMENKRLIKPLTNHLTFELVSRGVVGGLATAFGTAIGAYTQLKLSNYFSRDVATVKPRYRLAQGNPVTELTPELRAWMNQFDENELAINRMLVNEHKLITRLILTGEPGVGKSTLAEDIAKLLKSLNRENKEAIYLELKGVDFCGQVYVGDGIRRTQENIAIIHEAASKAETEGRMVVILIDEIDAAIGKQGDSSSNSNYNDQTVNILTSELDTLQKRYPKLIIIGTTNNPHKIDRTMRDRRFEMIEVPVPNDQQRLKILNNVSASYSIYFNAKSYIEEIAKQANSFTGDDLTKLITVAYSNARLEQLLGIKKRHLMMSFSDLINKKIKAIDDELYYIQGSTASYYQNKKRILEQKKEQLLKLQRERLNSLEKIYDVLEQEEKSPIILNEINNIIHNIKAYKENEKRPAVNEEQEDDSSHETTPPEPQRDKGKEKEDSDPTEVRVRDASSSGSSEDVARLALPRLKITLSKEKAIKIEYIRMYKYETIAQALKEYEKQYNSEQQHLMALSLDKTYVPSKLIPQIEKFENARLEKENELLSGFVLNAQEQTQAEALYALRRTNAEFYEGALESYNDGIKSLEQYLTSKEANDYYENRVRQERGYFNEGTWLVPTTQVVPKDYISPQLLTHNQTKISVSDDKIKKRIMSTIKSQILMNHSASAKRTYESIILHKEEGVTLKKSWRTSIKEKKPSFINKKTVAAVGATGLVGLMWYKQYNPINLLPQPGVNSSII